MIRLIAVEFNDRHVRCQVRDGGPPDGALAGEVTLDRETWDKAVDAQNDEGVAAKLPVRFELETAITVEPTITDLGDTVKGLVQEVAMLRRRVERLDGR